MGGNEILTTMTIGNCGGVKDQSSSFCEVFPGPNAPLSQAIAKEYGSVVVGEAITKAGKGHKSELQALADVIGAPLDSPNFSGYHAAASSSKTLAETVFNRLAGLEASKATELWQTNSAI